MDSDCYFITNFTTSAFLYDKKTPFFGLRGAAENEEILSFPKKYLGREGKTYNFMGPPQVFSKIILEDMEKKLLCPRNLNWLDLIKMDPHEFQWYGEWFLKCKLLPLIYTPEVFKVFMYHLDYLEEKSRGTTIEDLINQNFLGIVMQNGWVKTKEYSPHRYFKIIKLKRKIQHFIIYSRDCPTPWGSRKWLSYILRSLINLLRKKH